MILCSTIRKIVGKTIYKVSFEEHSVQVGTLSANIDAHHEYFVSVDAAIKNSAKCKAFNGPMGKITAEQCTLENHYMRT